MGADYYENDAQRAALLAAGNVPIGVGEGSTVMNAILDKNARIGKGCSLVNKDGVDEADRVRHAHTHATSPLHCRPGPVCLIKCMCGWWRCVCLCVPRIVVVCMCVRGEGGGRHAGEEVAFNSAPKPHPRP